MPRGSLYKRKTKRKISQVPKELRKEDLEKGMWPFFGIQAFLWMAIFCVILMLEKEKSSKNTEQNRKLLWNDQI